MTGHADGRVRVAVTGFGVKSPAGNDPDSLWQSLLTGMSSAAAIGMFDASELPVDFACEVVPFAESDYVAPKESRRLDRAALFGLAAALDAWDDADRPAPVDPTRFGVIAGTGIGGLHTLVEQQSVYERDGYRKVSPHFVPMMMPNAAAAHVAMRLGAQGPCLCVATACAAGSHAIGEGLRLLRAGVADVVLAGGTEAPITPVAIAAFWRMGALSQRSEEPAAASRPFDVDRDGFVMGEGAAFLTLERWDHAEARGARIHGEVLGYGATADAHHVTAPAPGGVGAIASMRAALHDAGVGPEAVGHVNAHGTSTPLNDAAEAEAVNSIFGGDSPPVTSVKGVTGHMVGAAGAVEAVVALLSVREGLVPPTANHRTTDPAIALDIVSGEPREVPRAPVISNSFGFGGHNASLVLAPA